MSQVGQSVPKKDGMGLVLGKPAYTDDFVPNPCLCVKILRSPHAFAKIKAIDSTRAMQLEGVECVLTWEDFPRNIVTRVGQSAPEASPYDKYALDQYVRYIGDEVAVVAASDEKTAEKALKLIRVEYEVFEPVLDFEQAENHSTVIHPEAEAHVKFDLGYAPQQNIVASCSLEKGNIAKTLENCDHVIKRSYYTQGQAHAMMEPPTCYSYFDFQRRLVIVSSTQVPFHVRRIVGKALNIPLHQIKVIKPRIGGGFGGKQAVIGEFFTAAVTLRTGKACHLKYTRQDTFDATYARHPMRLDVTLGADAGGRIRALDLDLLSNTGAYGEHGPTVYSVGALKTLPMYSKTEATRFNGKVVYTNQRPAGALRGYGVTQCTFAIESIVNEMAERLGMDPVELRLMNRITPGDLKDIFGVDGSEVLSSSELKQCIETGKQAIGWNPDERSQVVDKHTMRGYGMAMTMQGSGIANIDMGSVTIKLNDDGFFNLLTGATDIGTGSDTILAQIAAEVLGVPTDQIIVISQDTDVTPFDTGAYASSTTYITGNAAYRAADEMKQLLLSEAADILNCTPEAVQFDGHTFIGDEGEGINLEALSSMLFYEKNQKQLSATGSFTGKKSPPPVMAGYAKVDVDLETGEYKVLDYVGVVDCGTVINPQLALIQAEGGVVQGIGMATSEEVTFTDRGQLVNRDFMTYKMPCRRDLGNIQIRFAPSHEASGPFGAKSIGEVVLNTPPPAIAEAVYQATGVRIRELPITAEKILKGLHENRQIEKQEHIKRRTA